MEVVFYMEWLEKPSLTGSKVGPCGRLGDEGSKEGTAHTKALRPPLAGRAVGQRSWSREREAASGWR